MNKKDINFCVAILVIFLAIIGLAIVREIEKKKPHSIQYGDPYSMKIINEHKVECVSGKDTINLYFENAYNLAEERLVFIEY